MNKKEKKIDCTTSPPIYKTPFKSFEEPLYEELALKQLPDKSLPPGIPRWFKMAKNKRSTESVRSSSKAVRKFEAPQHNESASKKMPDLSRSGIGSNEDQETRSSSTDSAYGGSSCFSFTEPDTERCQTRDIENLFDDEFLDLML
ncbi:hypothetical protein MAR_002858 [Mya arenaria]|uniref:Uncharacterized protein n=1 Tax=Mya arenaria TaxID=6604 RepID=A0ABY7G4B9_MYAAR|nr:hypothetical protein MAR_002858 [Mya arenaria]